ncbi:MAG: IS110 family transposase [Armatimonadetes bacterium]|nr:IS110 family transposase [Armatimonadota bacterium]
MVLVGIDWADASHTYCLMDEAGTVLTSGSVAHTAEGLDHLIVVIRTHAATPQDVCVALETRQGPLVGALLDQGFTVYAINPKAVERHRERFRVAGAKSDLQDAWVLATLLRTDRALYRPIRPDSETAQELRTLTRDRAELVRTHTMLSNQLTSCLKAYFPEFLTLFDDPQCPTALAALQAFPTLEALRKAPRRRLEVLLRRHHYPGAAAKAEEIHRTLHQRTFQIPPVVIRTKARLAVTLACQLATLDDQIAAYEAEIRRVLKTHPDGALYQSLPGAAEITAARMVGELGDNGDRCSDAAIAQCEAGTAPVTRQSGTTRIVRVRRACIHPLRETLWHFAFSSIRWCAWAKEYYARARARGKKHAETVRMLANVWLRIIIAMRRDRRPYDETIFLRARAAHLAPAS